MGSLDFSGLEACKEMSGGQNAPVMIDSQIRPYYVLPDLADYPESTKKFNAFTKGVWEAANRCRAKLCGNRGDCQPKTDAWSIWKTFVDFDNYFVQDSSVCLKLSMFKEQQEKDAAADKKKEEKELSE
jgi:hypothetical protein